MRKLFLIRHAKSSWDHPELSDRLRPLKKRGVKDAELMGHLLRKASVYPDAVLSSPAVRALATAEIICRHTKFAFHKVQVIDDLYFKGMEAIMQAVHKLNPALQTVFVFGHNPDLTELVNCFSDTPINNLPTCGIVGIDFNIIRWEEADFSNGRIVYYEYPAKHR